MNRVLVLVLTLSLLGAATATAAAPQHKPLPPDSCAKLTTVVEADVPDVDFQSVAFFHRTSGYLDCSWSVEGEQQAFSLTVSGGKGKWVTDQYSGTSKVTSARAFADAFRWELGARQNATCPPPNEAYVEQHQQDPGGIVGPPWSPPQMTTIDGHLAWVEDGCVTPDPGTPLWNPSTTFLPHEVQVLDGNMIVSATWYALRVDKTTAQMIPFIQYLIAKYAPLYSK